MRKVKYDASYTAVGIFLQRTTKVIQATQDYLVYSATGNSSPEELVLPRGPTTPVEADTEPAHFEQTLKTAYRPSPHLLLSGNRTVGVPQSERILEHILEMVEPTSHRVVQHAFESGATVPRKESVEVARIVFRFQNKVVLQQSLSSPSPSEEPPRPYIDEMS